MNRLPDATEVIAALKLIAADFDGRPTHRVRGTGGKFFEFFPTHQLLTPAPSS